MVADNRKAAGPRGEDRGHAECFVPVLRVASFGRQLKRLDECRFRAAWCAPVHLAPTVYLAQHIGPFVVSPLLILFVDVIEGHAGKLGAETKDSALRYPEIFDLI
jgi:hypothetical protein